MAQWLNKISKVFRRSRPLQECLPQMLKPDDPRVLMRPFYDDWLCPYTGSVVPAPGWDGKGETLLQCPEIREHLLKLPLLIEEGERAPMKSFQDLLKTLIEMRFEKGDNYKMPSKTGEWVCPYCLAKTEIILVNWDGSIANNEFFMPGALKHFEVCEEYQKDPVNGAKSKQEILEAGGERAKLRKYLGSDPRFKVFDPQGAWVCPFAARPIERLNVKKEGWTAAFHNKLLDYMLSAECPGKYSQFEVEKSLDELKQAAVTKVKQF